MAMQFCDSVLLFASSGTLCAVENLKIYGDSHTQKILWHKSSSSEHLLDLTSYVLAVQSSNGNLSFELSVVFVSFIV